VKQLLKAAVITVLLIGCKKSNDLQPSSVSAQPKVPVFIRIQAVDNDGFVTMSPIAYTKY
jgi:hypothetical protein